MQRFLSRIIGSRPCAKRPSRPKKRALQVECLENRLVPATIKVTTFADVVNPGDGVVSLREAINQANSTAAPDTIKLKAGVYKISLPGLDNTNVGGDFDVSSSLTITGVRASSTIIEGISDRSDRLFDVLGAIDMTFANLTLRNAGNVELNGGAAQALTANITLNNCVVSGMTGLKGGSINAEEGNVTLNNTTVTNSSSRTLGGAINTDSGNVTLVNSTVANSSAPRGSGGGIFTDEGNVTLRQSTVRDNQANAFGGGLATFGNVTLVNSTVANNRVDDNSGGGIFARGDVVLVNSRVTGNRTEKEGPSGLVGGGGIYADRNVTLNHSTVSGNSAAADGGGILAPQGTVTLDRSTVSGNHSGSSGGGIFTNTVNLTNSTVSGNSALSGGGIMLEKGTFLNATVVRNVAQFFGGGVMDVNFDGDAASFKNTIVAQNTAGISGQDLFQFFFSQGHNFIGDGNSGTDTIDFSGVKGDQVGTSANRLDPRLGPLQNNGGPTQTHALLPGSTAIDRGDNSGAPARDQRGVARPRDGDGNKSRVVDIGAFER